MIHLTRVVLILIVIRRIKRPVRGRNANIPQPTRIPKRILSARNDLLRALIAQADERLLPPPHTIDLQALLQKSQKIGIRCRRCLFEPTQGHIKVIVPLFVAIIIIPAPLWKMLVVVRIVRQDDACVCSVGGELGNRLEETYGEVPDYPNDRELLSGITSLLAECLESVRAGKTCSENSNVFSSKKIGVMSLQAM